MKCFTEKESLQTNYRSGRGRRMYVDDVDCAVLIIRTFKRNCKHGSYITTKRLGFFLRLLLLILILIPSST